MEAFLEVSVSRCPACGSYYAEAAWYALVLESDLECGRCGEVFSATEHFTDRALLRFKLDKKGKITGIEPKAAP
jgi:uncharacterized C2H2 Zn-finger protein